MLPHQQLLGMPPMQKYRRRSINIDLQSHITHSDSYQLSDMESADELTNLVHIRELNVTAGGLGCSVWDGSIILARYIKHNSHLFANKYVLELGSGVGLPSIVASRYSTKCIVTDYIDELLVNYKYNLNINSNIDDIIERDDVDTPPIQQIIHERNNMKQCSIPSYLDWHIVEDIDTDDENRDEIEINNNRCDRQGTHSKSNLDAELDSLSKHMLSPLQLDMGQYDYNRRPDGITGNKHLSLSHDPIITGTHSIDCIIAAEVLYTPTITRISLQPL